ncbi:WD40/YVTN/BNR-like repeat-containing protein [Massilia putida]|uniref:WD40/YVTN/BNR-like repeat-containing protein n=1 Tax=Massilia putida TaxID=1141883 RepID=UPI0012EBBB79|nr:YCF48-related protein [Massilia putida]
MRATPITVMLAALGCGAASVLHAAAPASVPAPTPAFVPPLDIAARATPYAAVSPLIAVAHAGQRLVAAGWRGHIVISDDQGRHWTQATVPVSVDLVALGFPTPAQGWAVGHGGVILHSSDGGRTWVRQADGRSLGAATVRYYEALAAHGDPGIAKTLADARANTTNGPELPWLGVHFLNEREGYVVGAFNSIMKTEDGGKSWLPWMERVDNPKGYHLNAITAVGQTLYIAAEQGTVFRLKSGGARFEALDTGYRGSFFGIVGNDEVLLAYGLGGVAYRSADGGTHWQPVQTGVHAGINAGTVLADGRMVLATQDGKLLVASADGARIAPLAPRDTMLFAGVTPAAPGTVLAVGLRGSTVVAIGTNVP